MAHFTRQYKSIEKEIQTVFETDEEEILSAFLEIGDDFDIDISLKFGIDRNEKQFWLKGLDDIERLESYSLLSNSIPIIMLSVVLNDKKDDVKTLASKCVECINYIYGYEVSDYDLYRGQIVFHLNKSDNEKDVHKLSIDQISSSFSRMKDLGYKLSVEKIFKNVRNYNSHVPMKDSSKLYNIKLSKSISSNDISIIDNMKIAKDTLLSIISKYPGNKVEFIINSEEVCYEIVFTE